MLCFLRIPELEILGRHYGVLLRIQYKQLLAESLSELLQSGEDIYQMAGHELVVHLNSEEHQQRIPCFMSISKVSFCLEWHAFAATRGVQLLQRSLSGDSSAFTAG